MSDEERINFLSNSFWSKPGTYNLNHNPFNSSKLEEKVNQWFDVLKIETIKQFHIVYKGNACKFYDFLIKEKNTFVEVNGDYWHANPQKYKSTDIIKYPGREITAQQKWDEDNFKKELAYKHGYKLITFWESEIKKITNVNDFLQLYNEKLLTILK